MVLSRCGGEAGSSLLRGSRSRSASLGMTRVWRFFRGDGFIALRAKSRFLATTQIAFAIRFARNDKGYGDSFAGMVLWCCGRRSRFLATTRIAFAIRFARNDMSLLCWDLDLGRLSRKIPPSFPQRRKK